MSSIQEKNSANTSNDSNHMNKHKGRLFIAEKPSLARAIAEVLPKPHARETNYIVCGNGDIVAWCAGHILKLVSPDSYHEDYKKWLLSHLPIIPETWKREVSIPELFKTLKSLLGKTSHVVHAGDPDREGQLLVDEVIHQVGYTGKVDRILISDLNPGAVAKSLNDLKPNTDFSTLSHSAEARQKADWLYGLNMTRLYTLLGRLGGYDGVLSVGRVQTPLLGLIVRRDKEIDGFKSKPYHTVFADVQAALGPFKAAWKPGASSEAFLDDEDRLIDRKKADEIVNLVRGQEGRVTLCHKKKKTEPQPLPYSLADLQIDAGKKLNFSAKETLDICQSLYETHRLTTYPRSDCSYLPEDHFLEADSVISAIESNLESLSTLCKRINDNGAKNKSRAWNDKKVTAHHAIIPTPRVDGVSALSAAEKAVYELISKRYLSQFFAEMEYMQTVVEVEIAGELFKASGRQMLTDGWCVVYQNDSVQEEESDDKLSEEADQKTSIPELSVGDLIKATDAHVLDKKTQPPQKFSDATLVKAMVGISRFVNDPEIKKMIKETDGIGTPATQAQIIQTLYDRNYIEKKGKFIQSTDTGKSLISVLPEVATMPDMTAIWEMDMRKIINGEMTLNSFLSNIELKLTELINHGKLSGKLNIAGIESYPCPMCQSALQRRKGRENYYWFCPNKESCAQDFLDDNDGKPMAKISQACINSACKGRLTRRSGKNGFWWGCSEYVNGCKVTLDDDHGKPVQKITYPCMGANCQGQLSRRPGKNGFWWGCSEYKNGCKVTANDVNGKPVILKQSTVPAT